MPNTDEQINISDINGESDRRDRLFRRAGYLLSALAHLLLVAYLLLANTRIPEPDQSQKPIEVDLVPAENPKPAEAKQEQLKPEPPKPEPQMPEPPKPEPQKPEPQKPEPPKPEPPKPEPPKPEQKEPEPEKPKEASLPPPPPPQLVRAPIAKKSSAPRRGDPNGAFLPPDDLGQRAPKDGGKISFSPRGTADAPDLTGPAGTGGTPLRQSEEDFVLAQILKYWRLNFLASADPDAVVTAIIYIERNGTLAPPLNRYAPWNPGTVIPKYADMVKFGNSYQRDILEGFYMALRLSQPLELPGVESTHWPKRVVVRFKLSDVWLHTGSRQ